VKHSDDNNCGIESIDTPSLERRVAHLETHVADLVTIVASLQNLSKYIVIPRAGQRNCPHCSRRLSVPPGAKCPVCGKQT
jgi:hypothetical protein